MSMIQTLEGRQMMSVSPAPLAVACTSAADRVAVSVDLGKLKVAVNGIVKANVTIGQVSGLVLDGCGGADVVCLNSVSVPVTVKVGASVVANVGANKAGGAVLVHLGVKADVLAKLNLSAGLKLAVGANVDAAVALLAKLKIGVGGVLCAESGAVVDVKACLGLLAKVGVQTGAAIDAAACVDLCAKVGIKPIASINLGVLLGLTTKINAQLDSCVGQLASVGVRLNLGLSLNVAGLIVLRL